MAPLFLKIWTERIFRWSDSVCVYNLYQKNQMEWFLGWSGFLDDQTANLAWLRQYLPRVVQ